LADTHHAEVGGLTHDSLHLWLQGTFINFREEEIFIFGAWVYAIMRLTTPIFLPINPPFPYAVPCQLKEARANTTPSSLTNEKGRNVGNNGTNRFWFLLHP
jgi:hypothetical protein